MIDFDIIPLESLENEFPVKRDCIKELLSYIEGKDPRGATRICILYGLRRTGKTVLIKQAILSLSEEEKKKTLLINCKKNTDFRNVVSYINQKILDGYKNFFINETTYAQNFQEIVETLSDHFVSVNKARIILSGTDSLGLSLPSHDNLYDRAIYIHTTYISFLEFARLTGNNSIDYYMKHGNILSDTSPFENYGAVREYIETSIVKNLINSLDKSSGIKTYPQVLTSIYENRELENAIQRIINQYSQKITIDSLRKQFRQSPFETAINAIIGKNSRKRDFTILGALAREKIIKNVMDLLNVENDFKTSITQKHFESIKNFLSEMDVITKIPVITSYKNKETNTDMEFITQPGMYHANMRYTIEQLEKSDKWYPNATKEQKEKLLRKTYECSAEKILENFVIFDVYKMLVKDMNNNSNFFEGNGKWYVSKLTHEGDKGKHSESGLIVFDKEKKESFLFEIKHSKELREEQSAYLESENFRNYVTENFGVIKDCAVLYNGRNRIHEDDDGKREFKVPRFNIADFLNHMYRNFDNQDYSVHDTIKALSSV